MPQMDFVFANVVKDDGASDGLSSSLNMSSLTSEQIRGKQNKNWIKSLKSAQLLLCVAAFKTEINKGRR